MQFIVNDKVFTTKKDFAKYLGVTVGMLQRALNTYTDMSDIIAHCNIFGINYTTSDGVLLKTARDICKYYSIFYDTFYNQYALGVSVEEIIQPYLCIKKALQYTGCKNLLEYVKMNGGTKKDYTRLRSRLIDAHTDFVPEMLDFKGEKYNPKVIYIDKTTGKVFHSKHAICVYYNIYSTTLMEKLNEGMSVDDIVNKANSFMLDGVYYKSKKDLCRKFGISYNALRGMVSRGKTLEEAVHELAYGKFIAYGKNYKSYTDICKDFCIPYMPFLKRLYRGKSIEQAIEELKDLKQGKFIVNGKIYNSYTDICRAYNISYSKLYYRVHHGISLEDAIKE